MLVQQECVPCILDDVRSAAELSVSDEELQRRIVETAQKFLANSLHLKKVPSYYITEVHRILKRLTGIETPFLDLRKKANDVALQVAETLNPPEDGYERFCVLVQWAIAGNHLDFRTAGTGYDLTVPFIRDMLLRKAGEGLDVDERPEIYQLAKSASRVLYILDNVGEIALDTLLMAELRRWCSVTAAVRGGPITSDAVMDDALQVGLDRLVPLIVAGPDTLGISMDELSEDLEREMRTSELIIAKGQANYYVMSEYACDFDSHVVCLFGCKCDLVAADFGLRGKINVAKVLR